MVSRPPRLRISGCASLGLLCRESIPGPPGCTKACHLTGLPRHGPRQQWAQLELGFILSCQRFPIGLAGPVGGFGTGTLLNRGDDLPRLSRRTGSPVLSSSRRRRKPSHKPAAKPRAFAALRGYLIQATASARTGQEQTPESPAFAGGQAIRCQSPSQNLWNTPSGRKS